MGVLEIFYWCLRDILLFYFRHLLVSWRYFICLMDIFYLCPGDILFLSCRYFIGVVEIFY